jgi:hypothetical protein
MEQNFLNLYSKEFIVETSQIQEWITYLLEIKNQANVLYESTRSETTIYETLGKNMLTAVKAYYDNLLIYSDDPSQLFAITKIYCSIFEFSGRTLTQDVSMLNIRVNKYLANMNQEADNVIKSILQNSSFYMDELINLKKSYYTIQVKYLKLKADIEEAHLAKKKIEVDPKLIYNISFKDKAEQKILTLLKEMQIILPDLENVSKEVDNKKTAFNKLMKDSFELIVSCVFKNHVKFRETFFLLSKEKEEFFTRIKENAELKFAEIRETNYQLNDFVERKYAELKNIYYDSIDAIIINEDDYLLTNSFIYISDTLLNYAENFYNLMKKRKRILKEFHKFFVLFSKGLEQHINMYYKSIKHIQSAVGNFKDLCKGTKKTWDITMHQLTENLNSYSTLTIILIKSANNYVMKIANEIKREYVRFFDKWSKYSKQINAMKLLLIKIHTNKSKIILQMNELRSSLTNLSNIGNSAQIPSEKNKAKIERKISQIKEEDNKINENTNITCKKYKEIIIKSIEFLRTTVKPIRENEGKKLKGFSDILENFGNIFKNIMEKNLDLLNSQTEMSVNTDIYEEVKDIFSNYLDRFSITDKFFELIIKKIIKNSNFNSDDYSRDKINSYLTQKKTGSISPINVNVNNAPNIAPGDYLNQNYGNFGNKRDYNTAYEYALLQNTPNSGYNNYNPNSQNYLSGNSNFKNILSNNNNLIQSNNNFNQSSMSYSGVNLNFNISGNEDLLSSPDNLRYKNSFINKNNGFEPIISGDRYTLKDTSYFENRMDNNNYRLNYENSINISGNKLAINEEERQSLNNLDGGALKENTNNTIFTVIKNNSSRNRTASFEKMSMNKNQNQPKSQINIPIPDVKENITKHRNLTFNTGNYKNIKNSDLSINPALILDDSEKSDFESLNQKSPDMNFLLQNHLVDENRNFNHCNYEDHNKSSSSSLIETLGSLEQEGINFINQENFKLITNNGYENIKENEIKVYMEKLNELDKTQDKDKVKKVGKDPKAGNFVLENNETLINNYSCAYADKILMQGKLYVTSKKVAFRSMFNNKTFFGTTKLIIPIEEIERVEKKYNLLIFDNSLQIVTKKSKLFFTSFVSRDQCYNVISELVKDYKKKNKAGNSDQNNDNEDAENNENVNSNNAILRKSNLRFGNQVLKKIDFFKRLDNLHKENLAKFEQTNSFKPFDFYKNVYYNNDPIGNVSLPLIYNFIYNPEVICEELNCNKTFWESLYYLRKDFDMAFESEAKHVPKFYSDLDYVMSKLSNFEEENLNEFLDDIKTWGTEAIKYNYKFIHPIKKKMFCPEKVTLSTDSFIYLISPKMFIVEEHGYSSGFTYCDYFVSMFQYRFYCDYKLDSKDNCFKFVTSVSIGFQIHFLKSCMFKNMIETEGAKESEESIRFNVMEKMQQVFETQSNIFNEYFKKMTDENNQRLASSYANNNVNEAEKNYENINENEINCDKVNTENDLDNYYAKIKKRDIKNSNNINDNDKDNGNIEIFKIFNFEVEKKLLITVLSYVFLVLCILYILKAIFIDKKYSFDKLINTVLLVTIFFIFNTINK